MPIDWTLYENEVVAYYVKQDKTAEETIALLESNHGFRVTIKQFKTKFRGYKNVKSDEWALISSQVKKRALDGKDSEVYLNGRLLDAKRVKRELTRYDKKNAGQIRSESSDDHGWGLSRVRVSTPRVNPSRIELVNEHHVHADMQYRYGDNGFINTTATLEDAYQPRQTSLAPYNGSLIPAPAQARPRDNGPMTCQLSDPLFENGASRNLPWMQNQQLLTNSGYFPSQGDPVTSFITPPYDPCRFLETLKSPMSLSNVAGFSSEDDIHRLLLATTDLVSNNLLDSEHLTRLLCELERNHKVDALLSLLAIDIPTVRAAARSGTLLEAALNSGLASLAQCLYSKGAKLKTDVWTIPESALNAALLEFLPQIYPGVLAGDSGGALLWKVVDTEHYDSVDVLLRHGANIDWKSKESGYETPLIRAVEYGFFRMAVRLVESGANVNYQTKYGESAMTVAWGLKHTHVVEFLLCHGASIVPLDISNHGFLEEVEKAEPGSGTRLRSMVGMGDGPAFSSGDIVSAARASPTTLTQFVRTHNVESDHLEKALFEAISSADFTASRRLLQFGVNPNARDANNEEFGTECRALDLAVHCSWPLEYDPSSMLRPSRSCFVYLLVEHGADFNDLLTTSFGYLNTQDLLPVIQILVQAGLDLEKYGPVILENLGSCGAIAPIAYLLSKGVPLEPCGSGTRRTCLEWAATNNDTEVLEFLLDTMSAASHDLDNLLERLKKALASAIDYGALEPVRRLLEFGTDQGIASSSEYGLALLASATEKCIPKLDRRCMSVEIGKILELLVTQDAVVSQIQSGKGAILIDRLLRKHRQDLVDLLVQNNFPIDSIGDEPGGHTLLQAAAYYGHLEVVQLALNRGANVDAGPHPNKGLTALQAATCPATKGNLKMEIVRALLDHGANVHAAAAPIEGVTALQGAAISGRLDIAELLISLGVDVNEPPSQTDGVTALEGAAKHGHLDMVQFLLDAGAITDNLDAIIRTTESKGFIEVGRLLRQHALLLGIHLEG